MGVRMEDVIITPGSPADLPRLEPLWVAVHHRHAASMPELAPYVSDAETWAARSALYAELLAKPDTVLVLARAREALVGYGLAHVMPVGETWLADTWRTGARVGEIESVSVAPEHRGRGIGTRLLDALEERLAADGVHDLVLGVLPGNTAARRLYERRGYAPTWLYLSRLRRDTGS
jgi:ribosomal protein S18 acetylase RimI-like enzyme